MPAQNRKVARDRHRSDLMSPPCPDAHEEGMQRARRLGGRPGRLYQHRARMAAPNLADASVVGWAQARLADPRIEPKVAHKLSRMVEPVDVADRRHDAGCDCQLDAGDGHQPLHGAVVERALGVLPIEDGKIFAEPIEFPQMAVDRLALVVRQFLAPEPCPSPLIKRSA